MGGLDLQRGCLMAEIRLQSAIDGTMSRGQSILKSAYTLCQTRSVGLGLPFKADQFSHICLALIYQRMQTMRIFLRLHRGDSQAQRIHGPPSSAPVLR